MTTPTKSGSAPSGPVGSDELRRRVDEIDWFHSYEIAPGIVSPGEYRPQIHLDRGCLPEDLTGRSVLDIGAWDGFFSFEAERRGAARVVAADSWAWQGRSPLSPKPGSSEPAFGSKRGFELVHELRNSKVETTEAEVYDLDPDVIGTFDVVLFLGVLYHLPHPLLALEKVASVVAEGGMVIVETVIDQTFTRRPAAAFYRQRSQRRRFQLLGNEPGLQPRHVARRRVRAGRNPLAHPLSHTGRPFRQAVHQR
ncbi:MAG: methyltransferase domain-containing protein [Candidatus Microthrix sp.]|nr:methyltransferase domain-containing protein [Candidatus Microthrix sp.]MBK6437516.1 methyltransferase domain-containing protein [Candidatus Microthrix sp.]